MADLTVEGRRVNRKRVLEALHDETGSWGGDAAASRVRAFCRDPVFAAPEEYSYVGGLTLRRFYVDPEKPNINERRSLWMNLCMRFETQRPDPGGWDGVSNVRRLQFLIE